MGRIPGLGSALGLLTLALFLREASAGLLLFWFPGLGLVLLSGTANLAALTAAAVLGFWWSGTRPSWERGPRIKPGFAAGLVLAAAGGTVVLGELANVMTWVLPIGPGLAAQFNALTQGSWADSLFTVVLVAPFTEELLFRGVLLRGFARRWGVWAGLFLSSALFALFHLNVWQALPAFAAGLLLGWVFLRTGSLWYPVGLHALFNGLPLLLGAAGVTVPGYNTPLVPGIAEFQPALWLAAGSAATAAGLLLTVKEAPPNPPNDAEGKAWGK